MNCACCRVVNTICYWGERPQAKWKRPLLFILSILLILFSLLPWFLENAQLIHFLLFGIIFLIAVMGLVVSLFGCDACVARCTGDIDFIP